MILCHWKKLVSLHAGSPFLKLMLASHYVVWNYKFTDCIFIQISFVKSAVTLEAPAVELTVYGTISSKYQSNYFFIKSLVV